MEKTLSFTAIRPSAAARSSVGSDILLARHGSAISSLRLDRGRGQVVAVLADGSVDTAPNLIDPTLQMPGRFDDDTKLMVYVCAATVGVAAIMSVAVGIVFALANPEQLASFTAALGSYSAAM